MQILANSEDPDEMLHYVAFHQGLHCLLKWSSETEIQFYLEIYNYLYIVGHPKFIVSKRGIIYKYIKG